MDRARQDRVHEYAETGKPTPQRRHLSQGPRCRRGLGRMSGAGSPVAQLRPCTRQRWNGPGRRFVARHGWPQTLCKRITATLNSFGLFLWTSAVVPRPLGPLHAQSRHVCRLGYPSAHPLPFRPCASPSLLAACTGCHRPPDGKVRWQKRFASPARRMKRGLQFLKTINSRKFITNAKTSTPWQGPFTTGASPASCLACSPPLLTSVSSATPSST